MLDRAVIIERGILRHIISHPDDIDEVIMVEFSPPRDVIFSSVVQATKEVELDAIDEYLIAKYVANTRNKRAVKELELVMAHEHPKDFRALLRELDEVKRYKTAVAGLEQALRAARAGDVDLSLEIVSGIPQALQQEANKRSKSLATLIDNFISRALKKEGGDVISLRPTVLGELLPTVSRGDLMVIGARPGVGKTALAVQLMAELRFSAKVMFISLEMTELEIFRRFVQHTTAGVSERLVENKDDSLVLTLDAVDYGNTYIVEMAGASPKDIERVIMYDKPDVVIIDYLQLIFAEQFRQLQRVHQIAEITRMIKTVALRERTFTILLSQLNRMVEMRGGSPVLADLRDSGAIEQDADYVLFLHREGNSSDMVEIKLAKNRHGGIGRLLSRFDGERMCFSPVSMDRSVEI